MNVNFKISGIENSFNNLFQLNEEERSQKGAVKMIVDQHPGFPCRVSLQDAAIGEEVILFPYQHHKTSSPYQSSGPVFVRKNAQSPDLLVNEIPVMLLHRLLSLRVYDNNGMMIDAKTIEGKLLKPEIAIIFSNELASYIQVHNASPGCYNCQINRLQ